MPSSKGMECRLCLGNVYRMHNLIENPYTTDYELSIKDSIEKFFDIKISPDDNYSKLICGNCLTIIHFIHMHRKSFQRGQTFLSPLKDETPKDNDHIVYNTIANIKEEVRDDVARICVPLEYFITTNVSIVINSRERRLADSYLGIDTKIEERKVQRVDYKKNPYNTTSGKDISRKPYLVRDLVQENMLTIDPTIGWREEKVEKDESESLLTLRMQTQVFVCYACNKVFERRYNLKRHILEHA
ncbi:uncharacterized protein LOC123681142 [Harmonia axyridis]|uniref:uncharacterized protein LOC123681142 n=1 Tax=Harmonia axyridis TaxID=115357 RepID=UPI001E279539|nr:uncharacterized protein LOC123681142 [Harmonia axyridis]